MSNKLICASAGAGKTTELVKVAISESFRGRSILILTYTINNQKEIIKKLHENPEYNPFLIQVNGWFRFLLEEMIRPYQRSVSFKERVSNIIFEQSNPHLREGENDFYSTQAARQPNGQVNPDFYLSNNKVHTYFISKLVTEICEAGRNLDENITTYEVVERLASIYDLIMIDEVQDLVGWDYPVLQYILSNKKIEFYCVGDFRQTIYQTSSAKSKKPQTSIEKRQWFRDMQFEIRSENYSRRCIEEICNFADLVHLDQGYVATKSKVDIIPEEFRDHFGVFTVSPSDIEIYLEKFNPTILRRDVNTEVKYSEKSNCMNFGEAKGLSFDRVLIIPTNKQEKFLKGNHKIFQREKTEKESNKLYVALTRARYSVAFLTDVQPTNGVTVWTPNSISRSLFD